MKIGTLGYPYTYIYTHTRKKYIKKEGTFTQKSVFFYAKMSNLQVLKNKGKVRIAHGLDTKFISVKYPLAKNTDTILKKRWFSEDNQSEFEQRERGDSQ